MELTNNKLNLKYEFYNLTSRPSNPRGHLQRTAAKFKIKIFLKKMKVIVYLHASMVTLLKHK